MATDFERLWEHVTKEFLCGIDSIHGPSHWRRVEQNGLLITKQSGAIEEVVRLFAVFHDSRREHDGWDDLHGQHGAAYAACLRGKLFDLPDDQFELLQYACIWHTHGRLSDDPTIGTCWDADRLDLGRVGTCPSARYMSTPAGRELAAGSSRMIRGQSIIMGQPKPKSMVKFKKCLNDGNNEPGTRVFSCDYCGALSCERCASNILYTLDRSVAADCPGCGRRTRQIGIIE